MSDEEVVIRLTQDECWDMLRAEEFGRLAFRLVDEVHITPINYAVVRGSARKLDEDEEHRAENLPLRPWVGTPKYNVVEITPRVITGRAFHLSRPWLHLTHHD